MGHQQMFCFIYGEQYKIFSQAKAVLLHIHQKF